MFIDPSQYKYLSNITNKVSLISNELLHALENSPEIRKGLLAEMAMDYPSNQWTWDNAINTAAVGYDLRDGSYTMHALYKTGHDLPLVKEHFRNTLELIRNVPGVEYGCISALAPGAHLGLHTHCRSRHIFHLLLNDLHGGNCVIICNDQEKHLVKQGDVALFDYSLPHETFSHADNIRFNLMIDFLIE